MDLKPLSIPDVKLIVPRRHGDARGYFMESYNQAALAAAGIRDVFIQDDESLSAEVGTVRGLHCQQAPLEQAKLVRVIRGRVLDIVVDLRHGSPWYGQHVAQELSAAGAEQLYVPRGFAHGFCTLDPDTIVFYKKTARWDAGLEVGLAWDDPALGLPWPVAPGAAILSDKDRSHPRLADLPPLFTYGTV